MKRILLIVLSIIFIFVISVPTFSVSAEGFNSDITIVFSHDLHSHLSPFMLDGVSVGGYARIKTYIDSVKSENANTVVVDAGDFSMGTLFQSIFETSASEYIMLGELGFDATTFGNHEFDYGFDALSRMIKTAKGSGTPLPPILSANINAASSGLSENDLNDLNVKEYSIIKKSEYTIAVFGLLGRDAVELSSASELDFDDYIVSAKDTVAEIKNLYSPDVIICLSHGGTGDSVKDEDAELAKAVPDIDVIISGHTHTLLEEPITVGDTVIASCGEYGSRIGRIDLSVNGDEVTLDNYSLTRIDSSIPENEDIINKINSFKAEVNAYLEKFGYNDYDEVIAYSPFDFPEQSDMSSSLSEQQLGNLISDSYVYALKQSEGDKYVNVDVAVAPVGVIRASIDKGEITVAQAYEISSLGIGNDGVSGYPLCSVYLYGWELWNLAEVDASVSGIMSYAQLYCSGLGYSVNTNRMFMNKVYDCWLIGEDGKRIEIEKDKLYRVVSGITSAKMLGSVKSKSFGLLELTPKDADGNVIDDFDKFVVYNSEGAEVKEWKALADYLSSFPKNENGISQIPEYYAYKQGRKNINTAFKLSQIFVKWNFISWTVSALALALVAGITALIIVIIKKRRKRLKNRIVENEAEID